MKKILLFTVLVFTLILSGCSSNDNLATTVTGTIVNQTGQGVSGVNLIMGSYQTVTNNDGSFSFTSVEPGTYQLTGKGGENKYFNVKTTQIVIEKNKENKVGNIEAYEMRALSVIYQPKNNPTVTAFAEGSDLIGKIDWTDLKPTNKTDVNSVTTSSFQTLAIDTTENAYAFAFKWEPIKDADYYDIYYLENGTEHKVWSSASDTGFMASNPEAYLYLNIQLAAYNLDSGNHKFKIVAVTATSEVDLPVLSVPLGVSLTTYPKNIKYNQGILSWQSVVGASDYRVKVYQEDTTTEIDTYTNINETQYDLSNISLVDGTTYYSNVDAIAYEEITGWPVEVSRGELFFTR